MCIKLAEVFTRFDANSIGESFSQIGALQEYSPVVQFRNSMTRLGIEPRTYGLKVRCSNQLSYRVGSSQFPRHFNL